MSKVWTEPFFSWKELVNDNYTQFHQPIIIMFIHSYCVFTCIWCSRRLWEYYPLDSFFLISSDNMSALYDMTCNINNATLSWFLFPKQMQIKKIARWHHHVFTCYVNFLRCLHIMPIFHALYQYYISYICPIKIGQNGHFSVAIKMGSFM